jgi:hypothetical protein
MAEKWREIFKLAEKWSKIQQKPGGFPAFSRENRRFFPAILYTEHTLCYTSGAGHIYVNRF